MSQPLSRLLALAALAANVFSKPPVVQTAAVIEDSYFSGQRLTTFKLRYWRGIHGEMLTHRAASRGASSSRAMPTMSKIKQVWNEPAGPMTWASNKAGMQAGEPLPEAMQSIANFLWFQVGAKSACGLAYALHKLGVHKQWSNRCLEPWEYISVIFSATDLNNFYELRCHPDAQPEIHDIATKMREAQDNSVPYRMSEGEWHLPFITQLERSEHTTEDLIIMSTARCARISYGDFEGKPVTLDRDRKTYAKLVGSNPKHAGPTEHPAQATLGRWANFANFKQHRWDLERDYNALPEAVKALLVEPITNKPLKAAQDYPHYYRLTSHLAWLDFYAVAELFGVADPMLQHSLKKLLALGVRGSKDMEQDIKEVIDTLTRYKYGVEANATS